MKKSATTDYSPLLVAYLGVISGLVGGLIWFSLDTLTRGAAVGPAFFVGMALKLTFLALPFAFYSVAGVLLGLLFSLLQISVARKSKSVFLSALPPYFPHLLLWTSTLALCGLAGWDRNNLKIGGQNGPLYLAAVIGLSFLPTYLALMFGIFSWKRTALRMLAPLLLGGPLLISLYSLLPERMDLHLPPRDAAGSHQQESGKESLNILLITIDTMRRDHIGCYGNREIETPSIDRLASEGVLFKQCVAQAPITLPSHSSILTGMYPTNHGVRDNGYYRLDDTAWPLAEVLKEEGYFTSAFVSAFPLDARFGLDQGFDLYDDQLMDRASFFFSRVAGFYALSSVMEELGIYHPVVIAERKAEETTRHVMEWFDAIDDRPFFLWIHFFDPHNPLNPPEEFEARYVSDDLQSRVGTREERERIRSTRDFTGYAADSPEALYMKALYNAEVSYADYYVGKVLDRLDELDLSDRTLVVLTGDHGQSLFEHDYVGHSGALYAQTIDVPLIMRYPSLLPAGIQLDGLVQSVDIEPTILELLGMGPMRDIQGNSLFTRMKARAEPGADSLAYFETLHSKKGDERFRGIIADGWKLIVSEDQSVKKLYHVADDPRELMELSSVDSKRTDDMEVLLNDLVAASEVEGHEGQQLEVDSGTREILKSLGYVW